MARRTFYVATDEEIKSGKATDIYFIRTKRILCLLYTSPSPRDRG